MARATQTAHTAQEIPPPQPQGIEKHYTIKELESLLSVSRGTIDRFVRMGKLQRIKLGRTSLFSASNVQAILQPETKPTTATRGKK